MWECKILMISVHLIIINDTISLLQILNILSWWLLNLLRLRIRILKIIRCTDFLSLSLFVWSNCIASLLLFRYLIDLLFLIQFRSWILMFWGIKVVVLFDKYLRWTFIKIRNILLDIAVVFVFIYDCGLIFPIPLDVIQFRLNYTIWINLRLFLKS
jgi:hypothetical protein